MPFNVYVTRPIPEDGLNLIREQIGEFEMNPDDKALPRDELLAAVKGRDGIVCLLHDAVDAELMDVAGPQLKVCSNYAVGYNNVNVPEASRRGIAIGNTPGVLTETTADIAWTLLMAVARRAIEGDRVMRSESWQGWGPLQFLGADVHGKTLGIVGAGRIGQATARRATGFNMKILYTANSDKTDFESQTGARRVELDSLLAESDYVSVHVPLNDDTRHLIDGAALQKMKSSAFLINTARGPIVDEKALVAALKDGAIAGAGLDVYEAEPAMEPGLSKLDNAVLLPHIGSATRETRGKMAQIAAQNLIGVLNGESSPSIVNADSLPQ